MIHLAHHLARDSKMKQSSRVNLPNVLKTFFFWSCTRCSIKNAVKISCVWRKEARVNQRGRRNEKKFISHKRINQAEWVKANLGFSQESTDPCSMHAAVYLIWQKEKAGPYEIIWFHIMQKISRVQETCWLSQQFQTLHGLHTPQLSLERCLSPSYSYSSRESVLSWYILKWEHAWWPAAEFKKHFMAQSPNWELTVSQVSHW